MSLPSIELLKREKAVHSALAAVTLNRKVPSAEATALLATWAEGELSMDDVLLSTLTLHMEAKQP